VKKEKGIRFNKAEAAERVKKIWPILKKTYPDAKTALNFKNPLELLISTILSAQCTDVRVNMVTKDLFKKYKSAKDWAKADVKQVESDIKSTGFYHNKAVSIKHACTKTANVVLGNAFGKPAIACDTHVIRLSRRLGLSENNDPVKLEFDLTEIVPKKNWTMFSHTLILHGRKYCLARKPECENCPISEYCPAANNPALW